MVNKYGFHFNASSTCPYCGDTYSECECDVVDYLNSYEEVNADRLYEEYVMELESISEAK